MSPAPTGPAAPLQEDQPSRRRHNIALGLGIGGFLLMGIFWALIYSGAFNWRNPDKLHDEAWVSAAREICAPTAKLINDLPRAQTAKSPAERAATVDQGSDALDEMVERLAARPPDNTSDREVVAAWLADWRVYLGDRRDFTERLRADPMAKPLFTEVHGGWSTNAIDAFANANDLDTCTSPPDL
jgi:hypothetical protein